MWSNRPESWVEVVELRTMKRSSAWAVVTIRADKSRAKIRIISAFLARIAGNVTPDRAVVKSVPRSLLSIFSLRRWRATLIVRATDYQRGTVKRHDRSSRSADAEPTRTGQNSHRRGRQPAAAGNRQGSAHCVRRRQDHRRRAARNRGRGG